MPESASLRRLWLALSILSGQDRDHRHAGGALQRRWPRLRPPRLGRGEGREGSPSGALSHRRQLLPDVQRRTRDARWQATQADRALQELDEADGTYLAGLREEALRRIAPNAPSLALASFSQLIMTLIAAAVRHAIALE